MDRVLILLQECYFWPKMSEDARKYITQCDRCIRFKKPTEKDVLYPLMAKYPLEMDNVSDLIKCC